MKDRDRVPVYISYAHEDRAVATEIADAVEQAGGDVWIDRRQLSPGDRLADEINRALTEAAYVILVATPNSLQSSWVTREYAGILDEAATVLLPVIAAPCSLPPLLRGLVHVDLTEDRVAGLKRLSDFFRKELSQLVRPRTTRAPLRDDLSLDDATRREVRRIAKKCIDEVALQEFLFDAEIDRARLEGNSLHQRLLHLLHIVADEGQLRLFLEFLIEERTTCVRHQLRLLRTRD